MPETSKCGVKNPGKELFCELVTGHDGYHLSGFDDWLNYGLKPLSPWMPITEPLDLKHLGKLAEELGEATAATARCIIQGVYADHPVTGEPNRQWLENELADVQACIMLVVNAFGLNSARMTVRMAEKIEHLRGWHRL